MTSAGCTPLHVKSKLPPGDDRLMSTIDRELARSEACCRICHCSVILWRNARAGFCATVAFELDNGLMISQSAQSWEIRRAIASAFNRCRSFGAQSAEH